MSYQKIINKLAERKLTLGMSEEYIARKAGLARSRVHRLLAGTDKSASIQDIEKIAAVMGLQAQIVLSEKQTPQEIINKQAGAIARKIEKITQATVQLEQQGLSKDARHRLRADKLFEILAWPRRNLWLQDIDE
ncbi:MAG: helix-turn-helix domain-containing protein [Alphaproteobacteria bacterium]|nr:helix-turn-helix domain-containing protein [Alphaproteobacteria bacterium]